MKIKQLFRPLVYLFLCCTIAQAKDIKTVCAPNGRLKATFHQESDGQHECYLSVEAAKGQHTVMLIPRISLGLDREDASFSTKMKVIGHSTPKKLSERYVALHGKRKERLNTANEVVFYLKNVQGNSMHLILRTYNDGVCFRYYFPDENRTAIEVKSEKTTYEIGETTERWLQSFVTSYEGPFPHQKGTITQGEWGYPALFNVEDRWLLITEADVDRNYCATKLSNKFQQNHYQLSFPAASDGNGCGKVNPTIAFPWASPWRVIIAGGLKEIVESTLVEDVSTPSTMKSLDWIRPGSAAWIYWAYNHGTQDFKRVCEYIDLATEMNWEYILIDWEWDVMKNGGNLEDAIKYAHQKGVKPLMWYNSGGEHNRVLSTPRNRLITAEARQKEFSWLKQMGVYGIKVDFFESDKQEMMNYYIDLMEDAAKYKLMINFHGCTVPRGWSRTYPHLMTMEAIYGAEQYNNSDQMTKQGAIWNTVFPYTRNVVGSMDYTPVAFTDSQHPHTTTQAHELALSVIFESGIQHWADRPEGFYHLPAQAKDYMKSVPVAWDDTQFLEGYPGSKIVLARRKGNDWYVAGINGTNQKLTINIRLPFLSKKNYKSLLLYDGKNEKEIDIKTETHTSNDLIEVMCLPRGGFVLKCSP